MIFKGLPTGLFFNPLLTLLFAMIMVQTFGNNERALFVALAGFLVAGFITLDSYDVV